MAEKKEKRYVSDNAQLMCEWNWEKNAEFEPSQLTLGSHKKAWWRCKKGHEWQAPVNNRNKGRGCPYCSGNIVLKGYNDLQTINPTLAQEWNYEKNDNLKPEDFTANSGKKYGGNVAKITSGKRQYMIETKETDAHIVQAKKS